MATDTIGSGTPHRPRLGPADASEQSQRSALNLPVLGSITRSEISNQRHRDRPSTAGHLHVEPVARVGVVDLEEPVALGSSDLGRAKVCCIVNHINI